MRRRPKNLVLAPTRATFSSAAAPLYYPDHSHSQSQDQQALTQPQTQAQAQEHPQTGSSDAQPDCASVQCPAQQRAPFVLQYSLHEAVRSVRREILAIFPSIKAHLANASANTSVNANDAASRNSASVGDSNAASVVPAVPGTVSIAPIIVSSPLAAPAAASAGPGTVHVLVTFQPSEHDLLAWTPEAAAEKDRLLENFFALCTALCAAIARLEPAAATDFVDPCSGQPARGQRSAGVYSEVEGGQQLLGYVGDQCAQCVVLKHPAWGAAVYPATLITTASAATVAAALAALAQDPVVLAEAEGGDSEGGLATPLSPSASVARADSLAGLLSPTPASPPEADGAPGAAGEGVSRGTGTAASAEAQKP